MSVYDIIARALASALAAGEITPEQAKRAAMMLQLWERQT
jgi:hypothetical protein